MCTRNTILAVIGFVSLLMFVAFAPCPPSRPADGCVAGACVTCKVHVPSSVGGIAVSCELTAGDVTCLRLCDRNGCTPWTCF